MEDRINKLLSWWHEKRVAASFWLIVLASFAVTSILGYYIDQNRDTLREVQKNKVTIAQLQDEQIASCENFSTLKDAVNQFHSTLSKFLITAETARRTVAKTTTNPAIKKANLKAAEAYRELINATHTVKANCAQNR